MKPENWQEQIEDYVLGRLSTPLQTKFEEAMAADPALAEAVRQRRQEWEAGELLAENLLRSDIRTMFEQAQVKKPAWLHKNKWWLMLVAALVAVPCIWFLIQKPAPAVPKEQPAAQPPMKETIPETPGISDTLPPVTKPSKQSPPAQKQKTDPSLQPIALAVYEIPEDLVTVRGFADEGNLLSHAQKAFEEKNFRLAAQLLEILPQDAEQEALYLRAHARFLTKDFNGAKMDFKQLEAGGIYRREAHWYGLLAEMAAPGAVKSEVLKKLKAIRLDEKHPFRDSAAALLIKLG